MLWNTERVKSGNALFSLPFGWYDNDMGKNGTNKDIKKNDFPNREDITYTARKCRRGRQGNQTMIPFLVMQLIMQASAECEEEEYVGMSAVSLCYELEARGYHLDRRTLYKYIKEANIANWWLKNEDCTLEDATEAIENGDGLLLEYSPQKKEYFCNPLNYFAYKEKEYEYDELDIRIIAECIYATKFISQKNAERLANIVLENTVSRKRADEIRRDAYLVDRGKTSNKKMFNIISDISEAMADETYGEPHTPCKIKFHYLTHSIGDIQKPEIKKRTFTVNPYALIINDGNYYLLALLDGILKPLTFRVDRIADVELLEDEPREGEEQFDEIDLTRYTQKTFAMYQGEEKEVSIIFDNHLLDTVIDRFGTKKPTVYEKVDDKHFRITTVLDISPQFFAWVCGFGNKAKIESERVAEEYTEYIWKIQELYQS